MFKLQKASAFVFSEDDEKIRKYYEFIDKNPNLLVFVRQKLVTISLFFKKTLSWAISNQFFSTTSAFPHNRVGWVAESNLIHEIYKRGKN